MRKLIYIVSIVILSAAKNLPCIAQSPIIDSLRTALETSQHDTDQVNTLNKLAWKLKDVNPDTAVILSSQALSIAEATKWQLGIANSKGKLGVYYYIKGDYPKALEYYFKALKMNEELDRKTAVSTNLGNIGNVYYSQGDYPKVLEYYFKALKMDEELGNKNGIARHLGNIGSLYIEIGEFEKAEEILQEAITVSKEIGAKERLTHQYGSLSNLYDTTGKPAQAFEAYKLHILYRDSIDNEENTKAQTRTEMKYEYEKAELVKEQEEKEATRLEAEATSRRDNLQYSFILIALLVLFGGVMSLGFVKVSARMAEGIIFFSFLILFEFLLVLADPYIENWSGGAPGIKLLFNAGVAALIFPLHSFFESKLKRRIVKVK